MAAKLESIPVCDCTVIHQGVVALVKEGLPHDMELGEMAELFKCLSDPTRLKIVHALLAAEMCVCDIGALLEMSTPAISHHLKILRQLKLVAFRRSGKIVYYTIADEHIAPILAQALAHIRGDGNMRRPPPAYHAGYDSHQRQYQRRADEHPD